MATLRTSASNPVWHPVSRFAFRFACLYFLAYGVSLIFFIEQPAKALFNLRDQLAVWLGNGLFGLELQVPAGPNGSGDTTLDYLRALLFVLGALGGASIWTVLDRRRQAYPRLGRWLVVACRYFLVMHMLGYGFAKVFAAQFLFPPMSWLVTPLGESSPMRLAWAFMGYSRPYTVFTGLGEVTAGLLLCFRRTTTLGALVAVGVMANVLMINLAYDVPVKLFSGHLLLFAVALVARDLRRLLDVFVFDHPTAARVEPPAAESRRGRRLAMVIKVLVIGGLLTHSIHESWKVHRQFGPSAPKPPLYGFYEIETMAVDGQDLPPLLGDGERWRRFMVDQFPNFVVVQTMDGRLLRLGLEVDTEAETLTLWRFSDPDAKSTLTYQRRAGGLILDGPFGEQHLSVAMRERDLDDFLLVDQGFRWINEFPFNRSRPLPELAPGPAAGADPATTEAAGED